MYKFLKNEKREHAISNQILRSGTGIGSNLAEAQYAQTKADFIYKVQISLKEANETKFWLESLFNTDYLTQQQFESMKSDLNSIIYLLISILKTAKSST